MEKQQKTLITCTFFLALIGITLIVISLATDNWVESNPQTIKNGKNGTTDVDTKNGTTDVDTTRKSDVYFGLFKGYRILDYGFGPRESALTVTCEASEGVCVVYPDSVTQPASEYIHNVLYNVVNNTDGKNNTDNTDDEPLYRKGLFNYGFWVTSLISAAFSIVFGLIAMGFAIFNICGKPIETITGPMGLYLWNGTAFLFALLDMVMFLTLFLTSLKKNFLLQDDVDKFVLTEKTNLGYSFYLVPAAVAMYLLNIILLVCSGYKLKCSFSSEAEKVVDNGMILY